MADVSSDAGWFPVVAAAVGALAGALAQWAGGRLLGKAAWQGAINAGFASLVADLRAEIVRLEGKITNLEQRNTSLDGLLRQHGILPELKPGQASLAAMVVLPPKPGDEG